MIGMSLAGGPGGSSAIPVAGVDAIGVGVERRGSERSGVGEADHDRIGSEGPVDEPVRDRDDRHDHAGQRLRPPMSSTRAARLPVRKPPQSLSGVLAAPAQVVVEGRTFGYGNPEVIEAPKAADLSAERQRGLRADPGLRERAKRCHLAIV
jgi:hypothetical protein